MMTDHPVNIDDDIVDWYDELTEEQQHVIDHRVMLAYKRATGEDITEDHAENDEVLAMVGDILKRAYIDSIMKSLIQKKIVEVSGVNSDGELRMKLTDEAREAMDHVHKQEEV